MPLLPITKDGWHGGWLFMLQNLAAGVNVPLVIWTLSYEMVFYLLLAALYSWGVHRRSGAR